MTLIVKCLPIGLRIHNSNCNIVSMILIELINDNKSRLAQWIDFVFCTVNQFELSQPNSNYILGVNQFLLANQFTAFFLQVIDNNFILRKGPCKHEIFRGNGKLCFERAMVKVGLLHISAFPIDLHSYSHGWLIYILMVGWTEYSSGSLQVSLCQIIIHMR